MAERKLQQMEQEKRLESAKRFIEGLEEECKYFAKELHDGIANDLLALQMKTEMEGHTELAASVGSLRKNVRAISHKLMPPVFDHIGLNQLLKQMAHSLSESFNISISYVEDNTLHTKISMLSSETAHNVYRIAQEIIMNISQHSQATQIHITFSWHTNQECYLLTISDNGNNTIELQPSTEGIGLHTIADRIRIIHAHAKQYREETYKENIFELTFQPE